MYVIDIHCVCLFAKIRDVAFVLILFFLLSGVNSTHVCKLRFPATLKFIERRKRTRNQHHHFLYSIPIIIWSWQQKFTCLKTISLLISYDYMNKSTKYSRSTFRNLIVQIHSFCKRIQVQCLATHQSNFMNSLKRIKFGCYMMLGSIYYCRSDVSMKI